MHKTRGIIMNDINVIKTNETNYFTMVIMAGLTIKVLHAVLFL